MLIQTQAGTPPAGLAGVGIWKASSFAGKFRDSNVRAVRSSLSPSFLSRFLSPTFETAYRNQIKIGYR
jgi:hypothetical protein